MRKIREHIKLVNSLKKVNMDLNLVCDFTPKQLFSCCYDLKNDTITELYENYIYIQKELITDKKFLSYLRSMNNADIPMEDIDSLVECLQQHNKNVSQYDKRVLIEILKNPHFNSNIYYDYLEYFANNVYILKEQNIVADNLTYFYSKNVAISSLSKNEKKLLLYPFMYDLYLIPGENLKEVCELLSNDIYLIDFLHFLFINNFKPQLNIDCYRAIHENSKEIYKYLYKLNKMINAEQMYHFLLRWINNGCKLYDLKILENKLQNLEKSQFQKIFCNRSSYINFIFGNKLSKFPLDYMSTYKENLIIYAIINNKKAFLNLINEHSESFFYISDNSILFNSDFYNIYVNINILTLKDLQDLNTMIDSKNNLHYLEHQHYTFEEIKLLYNLPKPYLIMYNNLLDVKIDTRLLIMKQLIKKNLLHNRIITDEQIKILSDKLKENHLYHWFENAFKHIEGLSVENVIDILINYDLIKKFILQIHNQNELLYVIRNINKIQKYSNLDEIKEHIDEIDIYWNELVKCMEISQEFILEHQTSIRNFLLNNGAEFAFTYYKNCNSQQKSEFKKIVKAELIGEFNKLKYYKDDLQKEINFNLKDFQIKEWTTNNITLNDNNIEVSEYDDFYSTMILGISPHPTCLSYISGMYNHCLLACFDSNKKILYAKINGKIVARAMVRLTKGSYYQENKKTNKKLSFVDLENINIDNNINNKDTSENEEYLTLFLEKIYTSFVSTEQANKIKKMFVKLLQEKAESMGALLVLSNYYSNIGIKDYITTNYYMYISRSKAGSQYLDSLCGENSVSDEGHYKCNNFMIWQNKDNIKIER